MVIIVVTFTLLLSVQRGSPTIGVCEKFDYQWWRGSHQ